MPESLTNDRVSGGHLRLLVLPLVLLIPHRQLCLLEFSLEFFGSLPLHSMGGFQPFGFNL
jgi:hypothetical protein